MLMLIRVRYLRQTAVEDAVLLVSLLRLVTSMRMVAVGFASERVTIQVLLACATIR